LHIKTVVLSRNLYNIGGIFINIVQQRILNPTTWNWGAKTALFWAGFCAHGTVWTFIRLPEPNGLTYADLFALFENHVSARKFKKVKVDPFRSGNLAVLPEDGTDNDRDIVVGDK
jgi:SP family general alpha glucoside:H+ symporter-like MFS transporter